MGAAQAAEAPPITTYQSLTMQCLTPQAYNAQLSSLTDIDEINAFEKQYLDCLKEERESSAGTKVAFQTFADVTKLAREAKYNVYADRAAYAQDITQKQRQVVDLSVQTKLQDTEIRSMKSKNATERAELLRQNNMTSATLGFFNFYYTVLTDPDIEYFSSSVENFNAGFYDIVQLVNDKEGDVKTIQYMEGWALAINEYLLGDTPAATSFIQSTSAYLRSKVLQNRADLQSIATSALFYSQISMSERSFWYVRFILQDNLACVLNIGSLVAITLSPQAYFIKPVVTSIGASYAPTGTVATLLGVVAYKVATKLANIICKSRNPEKGMAPKTIRQITKNELTEVGLESELSPEFDTVVRNMTCNAVHANVQAVKRVEVPRASIVPSSVPTPSIPTPSIPTPSQTTSQDVNARLAEIRALRKGLLK